MVPHLAYMLQCLDMQYENTVGNLRLQGCYETAVIEVVFTINTLMNYIRSRLVITAQWKISPHRFSACLICN